MNPYEYITDIKKPGGTSAQEAIREALIELLAHKLLTEISVKALCTQAHVARTTFYSYYENSDQVLCEIEDGLIYDLTALNDDFMDHSLTRPEDLLFYAGTFRYIQSNLKTFDTLLIKRPDQRFLEKWKQSIKYHLWARLFTERQARNAEFVLEMTASLTVTAHTWVLKNPSETVLQGDIRKIVSEVLRMLDYSR